MSHTLPSEILSTLTKGGRRVCTQIDLNMECSQNLDYQTCSDRSRRAEQFCPETWSPERFLGKFYRLRLVKLLQTVVLFHTHSISTVFLGNQGIFRH